MTESLLRFYRIAARAYFAYEYLRIKFDVSTGSKVNAGSLAAKSSFKVAVVIKSTPKMISVSSTVWSPGQ